MKKDIPQLLELTFLVVLFFFLYQDHTSPNTWGAATTYEVAANNSISFPLSKGYVDGKIAYFIATDTSDNNTARAITDNLGYEINFAPSLSTIPGSAVQQGYEFLNGVKGEGAFGYQIPVAAALPGDEGYSPIVQLNFVEWNTSASPLELKSMEEITDAQIGGKLIVQKTNIVINSPVVDACIVEATNSSCRR